MVSASEVRAANAALKNHVDSLTAVFVGATNGIGLATLRAFAQHVPKPRAFIVGRSREKFAAELDALKRLNGDGDFIFVEADVRLIRTIDDVCATITARLGSAPIDLVVMSQVRALFDARDDTAEGLDTFMALQYYGRVRFVQNLLPVLSPHARVVSVLAGGREGKMFEDDLDLARNYSLRNSAAQLGTMMTLSWDYLAQHHPTQTFLHVYPGIVATGLLSRNAPRGFLGVLLRYVVEPLLGLFAIQPHEAGERMLYYATAREQYPPRSWSLDWDGTPKEVRLLAEYRQKGWADRIWEHTQRMFERAL